MTNWVRYAVADGRIGFGTLAGDAIAEHEGDMFGAARATGRTLAVATVRLLAPCVPGKLIGLWNNFHERAEKEGLHRPEHPLYFLKSANSYAGPGDHVPRPAGYDGMVVFEGELGIVIGRRAAGLSPDEADAAIFGYTCANDITSRELLKRDPAFVHWTRAKCADRYGVLGPGIATGLDPAGLRVRVELNGEEKQNYPVADMFFSPREIVSHISHDMTLDPGDVIICGTSVGVCGMNDGDRVDVVIDGIGRLSNTFG